MKDTEQNWVAVWVENQPAGIGHDATTEYLDAAGVSYALHDGMPVVPQAKFASARHAVWRVGHHDPSENDIGRPSLVKRDVKKEAADE